MGISMERLEIDSLMQIIQMCDMYQCQCLQTSAEHFLANLLTLRNVAEILTFSQMFNCTALEKFCIDFSLDNLPYLLENRYELNNQAVNIKENNDFIQFTGY